MEGDRRIYPEEVLAKIKEDGDFDKFRLRFIQKLKDKEDLRGAIVSMVKQSAVINRPGVERMNRSEVLDAIYGEIGNDLMNKISTGLWEVISSDEGDKKDIRESVQSTLNKLLNSPIYPEGASSSMNRKRKTLTNPVVSEIISENITVSAGNNGFPTVPSKNNGFPTVSSKNNGFLTVSQGATNGHKLISNGTSDHVTVLDGTSLRSSVCIIESLSDAEPNEPPGFSMSITQEIICPDKYNDKFQSTISAKADSMKEPEQNNGYSNGFLKPDGIDTYVLTATDHQEQYSAMDDDPDVPPGFG